MSANGRRVLVEQSHDLPLVAWSIAQRTGSVEDPPGKEGLTRLAGRLMRRTGGSLPPEELDERIDSLGAALSVDCSHSTMTFHGATISRSLDAFTEVVHDVLAQPSLAHEELERLKRETEAELIEVRDNDRALVRRWFRKKLFDGHPYSRAVAGTIQSIRTIVDEDIAAHLRKTLTSENLVFAFAGDIHRDRADSIVERIASALHSGAPLPDSASEPTMPAGRRLVIVDKPERTQTQILIGGLGTHPRDEDHFALHVGNTIFGGTFTARLSQEVRSKRGWSYGAYSSLPYDRRRRDFDLWTFPKAEDAAPCIALQLQMLTDWRDGGITKRELDWAKRYLVRSHAFAVDTATKRVQQELDEVVYDLPDGYHSDYVSRIRDTTLDQVNESVRRRISAENFLIVVVGTYADIGSPIRDVIEGLTSEEVVPYDAEA